MILPGDHSIWKRWKSLLKPFPGFELRTNCADWYASKLLYGPKCNIEVTCSLPMFTPFWISSRLPFNWTKSISPDDGHDPYALSFGKNHMAIRRVWKSREYFSFRVCQFKVKEAIPGSSQSPAGIFALISTLPYLNENESNVRIFALFIGFIINGIEPVRSHP